AGKGGCTGEGGCYESAAGQMRGGRIVNSGHRNSSSSSDWRNLTVIGEPAEAPVRMVCIITSSNLSLPRNRQGGERVRREIVAAYGISATFCLLTPSSRRRER